MMHHVERDPDMYTECAVCVCVCVYLFWPRRRPCAPDDPLDELPELMYM